MKSSVSLIVVSLVSTAVLAAQPVTGVASGSFDSGRYEGGASAPPSAGGPKAKKAPAASTDVSFDVRVEGRRVGDIAYVMIAHPAATMQGSDFSIVTRAPSAELSRWAASKKRAASLSVSMYQGGVLMVACAFKGVLAKGEQKGGKGQLLNYAAGQCIDFLKLYGKR
jgi:hypothetical protein